MKKKRKNRSAEEKLLILQEADKDGIASTCRRHGIASSLYYKWLDKYQTHGIEGLKAYRKPEKNYELQRLEDENRRLKQLLAEKELDLQLHKERLKKKNVPRR